MGESMTVLFLAYHGMSEHSGISKKILAQVNAFRSNGARATLCCMQTAEDGSQMRVYDGSPLRTFPNNAIGKFRKRTSFADVVRWVKEHDADLVYIRHDINANPFTVNLVRKIKKAGAKVIVEIPTWPYDGECLDQGAKLRMQLAIDRTFRKAFFRQVDKVVTYTSCETILGCPTIRISNGIDFDNIPLAAQSADDGVLKMLSVANIHRWHGLDRLIRGMAEQREIPSELRIVGDGLEDIKAGYAALARECGIEDRVKLLGPLYGEPLDKQFDWADIAIGSLGRHRSGISDIKTLKNREYAARGMKFIYSESDSDFDDAEYVLHVSPDERPVPLNGVTALKDGCKVPPEEIRESVASLSWKEQVRKIIQEAGI